MCKTIMRLSIITQAEIFWVLIPLTLFDNMINSHSNKKNNLLEGKENMAKNRYGKAKGGMQGNMMYNRPSGGYQKNLYRQQINTQGIKAPKGIDQKTLRNGAIAIGVVWVIASILLILKLKWWGLLIAMVIGLLVVGGLYFFIQYKERSMIKYYKQIGMTEEMYVKELKKRNVDKKQIEQVRKTWKKVQAEPVVGSQNQKKK